MLRTEKDDGSEAAMLIRADEPVIPGTFLERVTKAFEEIASRSDCSPLLGEVQEACAYRSQYPWLVESRGNPEEDRDSLVYAFHYALESYVPTEKHPPHVIALASSAADADRLTDLASEASGDPSSLLGFATGLKRVGLDYKAPQDLITLHVIAALRNYCAEREVGTSPDPW
ncbi:hypothetical protein ACPCSF_34705 [Streptomyces griseoincarnatus]